MYPSLKNSTLRHLEDMVLYNYVKDEQYELDPDGFDFVSYCTGRNSFDDICEKSNADRAEAKELVSYLTAEGCLEDRENQNALERFTVKPGVRPSLKYLQLHITERCNLNCRHCYIGDKNSHDLKLHVIAKILEEFSQYGVKLLITGGEPLLHRNFWDILKLAGDYPIRVEVLTNGTLVTPEVALGLSKYADGVQISLDGLKKGHEALRGSGTFEVAVEGIMNANEFMSVTCATMIHSKNLNEFDAMQSMLKELGVAEWTLDLPSKAGNMVRHSEIEVPYDEAALIFKKYGYSSGVHLGDDAYSCGSHICSVSATGEVSKCGLFKEAVGNAEEASLQRCWQVVVERYIPKLDELECKECKVLEECRGGCRFRAAEEDFYGKDPFMCTLYL